MLPGQVFVLKVVIYSSNSDALRPESDKEAQGEALITTRGAAALDHFRTFNLVQPC